MNQKANYEILRRQLQDVVVSLPQRPQARAEGAINICRRGDKFLWRPERQVTEGDECSEEPGGGLILRATFQLGEGH